MLAVTYIQREMFLELFYFNTIRQKVISRKVLKNGNPLLTLPRSGITKYLIAEEEKNSRLNYVEEYWWKENEDPVKPLGVEDLYVDLVKKDGTIIGPVRILSKQDVLNSMKLFEKAKAEGS